MNVLQDVRTAKMSGAQAISTAQTIFEFASRRKIRPLSYPTCEKAPYTFSSSVTKPTAASFDGLPEKRYEDVIDGLGKQEIAAFSAILIVFNIVVYALGKGRSSGEAKADKKPVSPSSTAKQVSQKAISPTPNKAKIIKSSARKVKTAKRRRRLSKMLGEISTNSPEFHRRSSHGRASSGANAANKENVQNAILMGVGFA